MNKSQKAIVFDFDGVVVDSAHECYIVAMKTWELMGRKIAVKNSEKIFRDARPFAHFANSFYCVLTLMSQKKKITEEVIDKILENDDAYKEFHKLFYHQREEMKKRDMKKWLKLHTAYPGIVSAIKKLSKKYGVFIASAKDKASVMNLLESFGLNIDKENIIAKEFSTNKAEQIKFLSEKHHVPLSNMIFVEDYVNNAFKVKGIGVKVALVEWGYSTPEQRKRAKEMGMPIIKSGKIAEQLEELL
jgi:phosphoglycolate phosphatase-like HAD superfamily hydrolase